MGLFVEISEAADRDLENIFDYTCSEHGVDQATNYVSSFDEVFQSLTSYPEIGGLDQKFGRDYIVLLQGITLFSIASWATEYELFGYSTVHGIYPGNLKIRKSKPQSAVLFLTTLQHELK